MSLLTQGLNFRSACDFTSNYVTKLCQKLGVLFFSATLYIQCVHVGACCNTAVSSTSQAPCFSVGFRAPPAAAAGLYDGSSVYQQLARCGVPPRPPGAPPGAISPAPGKPASTHQFAHELLTLHRLYTPPQSATDHFKPPFFPGEFRLSVALLRTSMSTQNHAAIKHAPCKW